MVLGSGFTIVYQTVPHNHMIAFLILSISYALINLSCQISMGLVSIYIHIVHILCNIFGFRITSTFFIIVE